MSKLITNQVIPLYRDYTPHVILARSTKQSLKEKIKGDVYTYLVDDNMLITIYGANNIVFKYTWYNLTSQIVHGVTGEMIAQDVYKRYRNYINILYFL